MYTDISIAKGRRFVTMDTDEAIQWKDGEHTYLIREQYDEDPMDPYHELYCYNDAIDLYNLDYTYQLGEHETKGIYDQLATIAYDFTGYREDEEWDACTDPDTLLYMDSVDDAIERVQKLIGDQWIILPLYMTNYSGEFDFHRPLFTRGDYDCLAIVNACDVVNNYQVASDMHDLKDKAYQFFKKAIEPYRLYLSGCCYSYDLFELIGDHYEYIDGSGTCYGYNLLDNGACVYGLENALRSGDYEVYKVTPVTTYEVSPVQNPNGEFYKLLYV